MGQLNEKGIPMVVAHLLYPYMRLYMHSRNAALGNPDRVDSIVVDDPATIESRKIVQIAKNHFKRAQQLRYFNPTKLSGFLTTPVTNLVRDSTLQRTTGSNCQQGVCATRDCNGGVFEGGAAERCRAVNESRV